ncbi:hypothetical protein IMCC3317_26750 [Kordia antarctica]|uniref:Uncharacterized protein n=1 Tax=Kordia antarctica TaxID=1218801 RepID=A0A7L4ZM84_9FLAO|nr:hypothetical protein [Kordia antarctica]QHI37296.1 hypothetical protein IMCC3317_26750 [Kordia antarctica]
MRYKYMLFFAFLLFHISNSYGQVKVAEGIREATDTTLTEEGEILVIRDSLKVKESRFLKVISFLEQLKKEDNSSTEYTKLKDSKELEAFELFREIESYKARLYDLSQEVKILKPKLASNESKKLTELELKNIIGKEFTSFVTGNSTSIGNYASIDTEASKLMFSVNYIMSNNNILGVTLEGASKDGILPIFSNASLNTGIGVGVTYHRIINSSVTYDLFEKKYFDIVELPVAKAKARQKYESHRKIIEKDASLDIIDKSKLSEKIDDKEKKEYSSLFENYKSVDISWFSFGAKLNKDSFKLSQEEVFSLEKVIDTSFTGFELNAQYSRYSVKDKFSGKPTFLNIGATFKAINNLSSLRKLEIKESTIFQEDETTEVSGSSTFNVYQGDYKSRLSELFFYLHYYKYFNNNSKVAFHLYPRVTFTEFEKPLIDLDVGLLFSLKSKKNKKAVVNAEIFYSLTDIGSNRSPSRERLLNDGIVGLRFTLPFSINL